MNEQEQFKRHIAFKLRIGDILRGKPLIVNEKFSFLELGSKRVVRVNVVCNIVDKYESEGDRKFLSLTTDDGSGQIKLRAFGEDVGRFRDFGQGETVLVIGLLRHWNNELYILPEIIKGLDPKYLLVRKLESEKEKSTSAEPIPRGQITEVRDKILGVVKNSEENGGIDIEALKTNLQEISPEIIEQEIQKFIEEGIVFEPRPGKVRYLG